MKIPKEVERLMGRIPPSVARTIEPFLERAPIVGAYVKAEKRKVADELRGQVRKHRPKALAADELPESGLSHSLVLEELKKIATKETPVWKDGFVSGGVYHGDAAHLAFLSDVYALYSQANPLHADIWPSVVRFEADIVAMTAQLLGGGARSPDDEGAIGGTLSSGGTESIMLAVKSYRDFARAKRRVRRPNIVVPASAHPAFDKAGHTLGVLVKRVPVDADGRANVRKMTAAVNRSTIAMVGSAPSFPHGVIDPIEELSEFARKKRIGFHTDACLGGFILPFAKEAGRLVPRFDFSLPGVTSMSADTHKFGYAAKGTSVVLYRGRELRRHQYFTSPDWSGGLYVTPGFAGSRPGALVAMAWATMITMGRRGYVEATRAVLDAGARVKDAIARIPELKVIGNPLWVVAFTSDTIDIYRVLDEMTARGWSLNGLQKPPAIHLCVTLRHAEAGVTERFENDLRAAVEAVRSAPATKGGMAPVYGLASSLPFKGVVGDLLSSYVDALYDA